MSTPVKKATPAPAKQVPAKAVPAKSTFDLSKLSIEDDDAPVRTGGRTREDNPFRDAITNAFKASAEKREETGSRNGVQVWRGAGKSVTVPEAEVSRVVSYIRHAADELKLGAAINEHGTDKSGRPLPAGQVRVAFCAKSRKQRRANTQNG